MTSSQTFRINLLDKNYGYSRGKIENFHTWYVGQINIRSAQSEDDCKLHLIIDYSENQLLSKEISKPSLLSKIIKRFDR